MWLYAIPCVKSHIHNLLSHVSLSKSNHSILGLWCCCETRSLSLLKALLPERIYHLNFPNDINEENYSYTFNVVFALRLYFTLRKPSCWMEVDMKGGKFYFPNKRVFTSIYFFEVLLAIPPILSHVFESVCFLGKTTKTI